MYLFTRQTRLSADHLRDGMEWAVGLTEKVNQITSLNAGLWASMFSPGTGTISWGTAVESLTELEEANAKLMVDDIFVDTANKGAALTNGAIEDRTSQFLHNDSEAAGNPKYVAVVQSGLANGSFQRGVEVGIEICQRARQLGGLPTSFLIGATGAFGSVVWITAADSLKELEAAQQAVNMNPDFVKFLDQEASPCYRPGVTTQAIWRRVV